MVQQEGSAPERWSLPPLALLQCHLTGTLVGMVCAQGPIQKLTYPKTPPMAPTPQRN